MKKLTVLALCIGVLIGVTFGVAEAHTSSPAFVTWSSGQNLTSTDLNNSLAHIHNTFSGGIDNSMVSATAGISHSKMATPSLLPKAWAVVNNVCTSTVTGSCTINEQSMVSSITTDSTPGQYKMTLNYTPTNAHFAVLITALRPITTPLYTCVVTALSASAPHVTFRCETTASVAVDSGFSILVLDV